LPCLLRDRSLQADGRVGPKKAKLVASVYGNEIRVDCMHNDAFWLKINTSTLEALGRGMTLKPKFVVAQKQWGYTVNDANDPMFWLHVKALPLRAVEAL
jgi:hypothetical protein